jgi:hypothetical protein
MTADSQALALHREVDSLHGDGTNSPGGFPYAIFPHCALAAAGVASHFSSGVFARTIAHQRELRSA